MMLRREDGQRTAQGLAALALGSGIAVTILLHRIFGEVHPGSHDLILGAAFFGGLGIAFPSQVSHYGKTIARVIHEWRAS